MRCECIPSHEPEVPIHPVPPSFATAEKKDLRKVKAFNSKLEISLLMSTMVKPSDYSVGPSIIDRKGVNWVEGQLEQGLYSKIKEEGRNFNSKLDFVGLEKDKGTVDLIFLDNLFVPASQKKR